MASSVSSERIFSSAGITISKRRNRLKPDIVEATQMLKSLTKNDFQVFPSQINSILELDIEKDQEDEEEMGDSGLYSINLDTDGSEVE